MIYRKGNLISLAQEGEFDVIGHGCNCFCTFGSGIAKQIKSHFPEAYLADARTIKGDSTKLGTYSVARIDNLTILNCYTQYRWGREKQHTDYNAIEKVMQSISIEFNGKRIALPKIGAGLGGGDWDVIAGIINEHIFNTTIVLL